MRVLLDRAKVLKALDREGILPDWVINYFRTAIMEIPPSKVIGKADGTPDEEEAPAKPKVMEIEV